MERQKQRSERKENVTLLSLKVEEGTRSRGAGGLSGLEKAGKCALPSSLQKARALADPVEPVSDF